jgi:hypothetical protein
METFKNEEELFSEEHNLIKGTNNSNDISIDQLIEFYANFFLTK